jgi:hypothetical protein
MSTTGTAENNWIKLYESVLDDVDLQEMPAEHFRLLVNCWLLAHRYGNRIGTLRQIAFRLHLDGQFVASAMDSLKDYFNCPDGVYVVAKWDVWQGNQTSTERARKSREKKKRGDTPSTCNSVTDATLATNATIATNDATCATFDAAHATSATIEKKRKEENRKEQIALSSSFDLERAFENLWEAYPAKGRTRKPMSQQYYVEAVAVLPEDQQAAMHARIMAPLLPGGKWAISSQWAKGFIQGLPVYLNQTQWLESPEPAMKDSYTLDLREPEDDTPIVRGELPVFTDAEFLADIAKMRNQ